MKYFTKYDSMTNAINLYRSLVLRQIIIKLDHHNHQPAMQPHHPVIKLLIVAPYDHQQSEVLVIKSLSLIKLTIDHNNVDVENESMCFKSLIFHFLLLLIIVRLLHVKSKS